MLNRVEFDPENAAGEVETMWPELKVLGKALPKAIKSLGFAIKKEPEDLTWRELSLVILKWMDICYGSRVGNKWQAASQRLKYVRSVCQLMLADAPVGEVRIDNSNYVAMLIYNHLLGQWILQCWRELASWDVFYDNLIAGADTFANEWRKATDQKSYRHVWEKIMRQKTTKKLEALH
ncbi:hypothetical protein BT63DRAFT_438583 [Microthyrium microscopicum]|uniref:Uncharacterized protein n=1 Tax=Microthyrium microscopicum TaxID=703497 RepID=A0A6A6UJI2_9PEZI|nr:hypothetical protein BT63DRAFT_438583 [Microthyrium microscopicum]